MQIRLFDCTQEPMEYWSGERTGYWDLPPPQPEQC